MLGDIKCKSLPAYSELEERIVLDWAAKEEPESLRAVEYIDGEIRRCVEPVIDDARRSGRPWDVGVLHRVQTALAHRRRLIEELFRVMFARREEELRPFVTVVQRTPWAKELADGAVDYLARKTDELFHHGGDDDGK